MGYLRTLEPVDGRRRFAVLNPVDGTEVGQVTQENIIAAGTLKGRWGAIAVAIADGAADGIAELVRAYRDARAAGRINPTQ